MHIHICVYIYIYIYLSHSLYIYIYIYIYTHMRTFAETANPRKNCAEQISRSWLAKSLLWGFSGIFQDFSVYFRICFFFSQDFSVYFRISVYISVYISWLGFSVYISGLSSFTFRSRKTKHWHGKVLTEPKVLWCSKSWLAKFLSYVRHRSLASGPRWTSGCEDLRSARRLHGKSLGVIERGV